MGVALMLPRAVAVTEELLSPVPDLDDDAVRRCREGLVAELGKLAEELPAGRRLILDLHRFELARRHPDRCVPEDEPFAISAARCRRAVGAAAVERCVRRRAPGPSHAVADVLAAGAEDAALVQVGRVQRAPWWASWYAGLGAGGQAVVAAEATTWATQLWTALDWGRLEQPVVGGHDDWFDLPGGRGITVRGRVDVRCRLGARSALVVVRPGMPEGDARADLGFVALASVLAGRGRTTPGRVMGLWPACGQVRYVAVEESTLATAAADLLTACATWVDAFIERQGA
ncbi:MAG TPA: hypothetical protein VE991_08400 [Acidimicrobiales bacterium]|nr:hypothetical protein [Acidimicrobiales bacterium]